MASSSLLLRLENDAEIAIPIRMAGRELEASVDERYSVVTAPLLMSKHTSEMQRLGMIGRNFKNTFIQFLRLSQLRVFLKDNGDRQRLTEG